MKKLVKLTALFAALIMIFSFVSCEKATEGTESEATLSEDEGSDTETAEDTSDITGGVTAAPRVISSAPTADDRTVIFGTAEENSLITTYIGDEVYETNRTSGKYFYVEVSGRTGSVVGLSLTAKADGKSESEKVSLTVRIENESTSVWVGRNSRLLYTETLRNLLGSPRAHEDELYTAWGMTNAAQKRIREATGKDTRLIVAIVPNPATVYYDEHRDYLYAGKVDSEAFPENAAYQYIAYMNSHSDEQSPIVLDLRAPLYAHKDEKIYFSTDTHYTELGAYYCYLEIMNAVKKYHPDVKIRTLGEDYTVEYYDLEGGDMSSMVRLEGLRETAPFVIANFEETGSYYHSKREDGIKVAGFHPSDWERNSSIDSDNPTAYFIGDSYGCYILPFIGANFSKVWTNPGVLWNYGVDYDMLKENKPDYVIFLICERNINSDLSIMG